MKPSKLPFSSSAASASSAARRRERSRASAMPAAQDTSTRRAARCGMRAACTSRGSRCAPLVLTLANEGRLSCFSHVDERCAGFFALGLAKASGLPVAVACTSGTAAAELLPAAVEAREARVPLLLLTADRPPELRESGAGQTIDQLKLYGGAAKWFFEVGVHEAGPQALRWIRGLACRAYWTALEGRPGVVHLNFPLREPLVCDSELPIDTSGRHEGRPHVRRDPARLHRDAAMRELHELVNRARRGVVVAGRDERAGPPPAGPTEPRSVGEAAAGAVMRARAETGLSEPAVAAELGVLLPEEATLFAASSMPVREIEAFWPARPDPPRVLCNRGANGIDGTVSAAFGAAADGRGPVVLLIGDVALAHDIGGLLAARRLALSLTIVLLDNGRGASFDFLPIATAPMAPADAN